MQLLKHCVRAHLLEMIVIRVFILVYDVLSLILLVELGLNKKPYREVSRSSDSVDRGEDHITKSC